MKNPATKMPPFGDSTAPQDSPAYAVYVRDQANACLQQSKVNREGVELYVKLLHERQLYTHLLRGGGKPFKGWTDFCLTPHPFGLGRSPQDIEQIIQEAKDPKTIAEKVTPLAEAEIGHGKAGPGRGHKTDSVSTRFIKRDSSYLAARIARDCPKVWEEMKAGKYPSVRAAAKAAGILKEATGFDLLKRDWNKASASDQEQFLAWVRGSGGRRK